MGSHPIRPLRDDGSRRHDSSMADISSQADALLERAGVRRLDDVAAIRVWGPDARTWLNGQITNQVALIEPSEAVYTLVVNVKGRILADAWVLARSAEELLLLVPAARREALMAHFDKYVVMEDVDVETDDVAVITVQGPLSGDVVGDRESFPCGRIGAVGRDVLVPPAEAEPTLRALVERAEALGGAEVSAEGWELARLRAGRPAYALDFDESVYPQEAGLKELAVSFDKGCYLGQEVVCMLENRGQLRRHLVRLRSEAEPSPGAPVRAGERDVGEVRSTAFDPAAERWLSLAYVKRAHAEPGAPVEVGGTAAEIESLIGK